MRALAALCLVLLGAQDPAETVRALIEKLSSDEIAERETAQTDLIKLGSPALPALKEHLSRAVGEVKPRLVSIIERIELQVHISKLLAPGPRVSIVAKDRPVAEVLAEIGKQGRIVVECRDLPAGAVVSIDALSVTPAAAIDHVCRNHGKLMYSWGRDRVVITPVPYRKVPSFDQGPFRLVIDGMSVMLQGKPPTHAEVTLTAGIIGPEGRIPNSVTLVIERFADDKSGDLAAAGPIAIEMPVNDHPQPPERGREISRNLHGTFPKPVSLSATQVTIRGYARLKFPIGLKRRAVIAAPAAGSSIDGEDAALQIRRWELDGLRLRASWRRTDKLGGDPPEATVMVLENARRGTVQGVLLHADRLAQKRGGRGMKQASASDEVFEFTLPEGFEPATLVYSSVEQFEEVRIPFEIQEALR